MSVSKSRSELILAPPATYAAPPGMNWGYGWYRMSAPDSGWVYSKDVSGIEGPRPPHDLLEMP